MKIGFEKIAQCVDRIRVVSVESDDDVAAGMGESFFVGAAVTAIQLRHDNRAHRTGNVGGAVGGIVVHDDRFIDEFGKVGKDLLNSLFFVEAGNNNRDSIALIHSLLASGPPSIWPVPP